MSYELTIPPGAPYVLITVDEPFTRQLAIDLAVGSSRLAAFEGLRRFLYDLRCSRNIESILTNYEFVHRDMPPLDLDRWARVALLVSPDDHSHDFVETVSVNVGHAVRLFRDEAAAIHWLTA
jgi:hypothetical protein